MYYKKALVTTTETVFKEGDTDMVTKPNVAKEIILIKVLE